MPRDALVVDIAQTQYGLVSRQQALNAGLSRAAVAHRLTHGLWERVEAGVYRLPGAAHDWHQRAMALCLAASPWAVISHESAAWIWKLDGVSLPPPEPIDVLVKKGKGLDAVGAHIRVTRHFDGVHHTRQNIPITTLSRTLIDLAGSISAERLERALHSAWRMGPNAQRALKARLEKFSPRAWPGLSTLKGLISDRDGTTDSELETRTLQLIRANGFPPPKFHYDVYRDKKWVGNFDFVWPNLDIALQCHGLQFHLVPARSRRDAVQQSALVSMGWHPLATTWDEVTRRPNDLINSLRRTFETANQLLALRRAFSPARR